MRVLLFANSIIYSGSFFAAHARARRLKVFVVVRFDHFLYKGVPFQLVFEGGDKESTFIGPVALVFVVLVPDNFPLGMSAAIFFEEGVVLDVGHIMVFAHLEVESVLSYGEDHRHGFAPGVFGGVTLFADFDLPILGDCPVLSIVPAGHVHSDAVQLGT